MRRLFELGKSTKVWVVAILLVRAETREKDKELLSKMCQTTDDAWFEKRVKRRSIQRRENRRRRMKE